MEAKIYYLHRLGKKTLPDGSQVNIKGVPAVTICIGRDHNNNFFRGISVAAEHEPLGIIKKEGRNRAKGRMTQAFRRKTSLDDFENSSAMKQFSKVFFEGPGIDNPKKYSNDLFDSPFLVSAFIEPTPFELTLFEDDRKEVKKNGHCVCD